MASAFSITATALKTIIDAEFQPQNIVAVFDNLHESLGRFSVEVGIAPIEDVVQSRNAVVQETWIEVKFYDLWTDEIDPGTRVDPTKITDYAERFRDAVRRSQATDPRTGTVWYFDIRRIQYPNDPTGNKTRFVATMRAFGNNAGLVETS